MLAAGACSQERSASHGRPPLEVVFRSTDAGIEVVEVLGLERSQLRPMRELSGEASWQQVLSVRSGSDPPPEQPPMLGTYEVLADRLRFTPRFPLAPGLDYRALFRGPDGETSSARFRRSGSSAEPTTRVVAVRPGGDEVPENLLRLYLHFSAPMSRGEAARRIRLLDAAGKEVSDPFVAPERELWNPARDRLTLLLDPGRVKRGIGPEAAAPPLRAGEVIRLVVDGGWSDGRGAPLAETFEKAFRVGPAVRDFPDPASWGLEPPAHPAAPLRLTFPRPLDHALLLRLLAVEDADGRLIDGTAEVLPGELGWLFRPERPWGVGAHHLLVDPALEDPAGNSLRRSFETAVAAEPGAGGPSVPRRLPFTVAFSFGGAAGR